MSSEEWKYFMNRTLFIYYLCQAFATKAVTVYIKDTLMFIEHFCSLRSLEQSSLLLSLRDHFHRVIKLAIVQVRNLLDYFEHCP